MDTSSGFMDLAASYIRTWTPSVVGFVASVLIRHGHHMDPTESALLTVVITAAFYAVARALEHYASPKFGWLLGLAKTPVYTEPPAVVTDESGTRVVDPAGEGDQLY